MSETETCGTPLSWRVPREGMNEISVNRSHLQRIRELCHPLTPLPTNHHPRLGPLPGIRAVLFDIYGTLFISGSGDIGTSTPANRAEAFRASLEQAGLSVLRSSAGERGNNLLLEAIRSYHRQQRDARVEYPEIDIRELLAETLHTLVLEEEIGGKVTERHIEEVAIDYECRVNPVWPMPDLAATLAGIRPRGLLLGLVSNAQFYTPLLFPAFLEHPYRELGFREELCVWSYRRREAKPSPGLFRQARQALSSRWGIEPQQALYVGNDLLNDIWPAGSLGFRTALFAGDRRSLRLREQDERCQGVQPTLVLTALSQILNVLP